jgi:hypothetical protein
MHAPPAMTNLGVSNLPDESVGSSLIRRGQSASSPYPHSAAPILGHRCQSHIAPVCADPMIHNVVILKRVAQADNQILKLLKCVCLLQLGQKVIEFQLSLLAPASAPLRSSGLPPLAQRGSHHPITPPAMAVHFYERNCVGQRARR